MVTFWSETPGRRRREVAADVATWAWVALWSVVAFRIHAAIAGYAEAGHALDRGGAAIRDAGTQVGGSLDGIPLIGAGAGEVARRAFGGASEPFVFVGGEFVDLITLIARVLAMSAPSRAARSASAKVVSSSTRPRLSPRIFTRAGSPT